jgi:energy-coupling factor transporter ATP-binding protein EcfA2
MLLRAMSIRPELIVFDEPCSGMDASLKEEFLFYLRLLIQSYGLATIYVSHHWDEVQFLSNQILYLTAEGSVEGLARPILTNTPEFNAMPPTLTAFKSVFGPQSTLIPVKRTSQSRYEGGVEAPAGDSKVLLGCGAISDSLKRCEQPHERIRLIKVRGTNAFRVATVECDDLSLATGAHPKTHGIVYRDAVAYERTLVRMEVKDGKPWLIASSLS